MSLYELALDAAYSLRRCEDANMTLSAHLSERIDELAAAREKIGRYEALIRELAEDSRCGWCGYLYGSHKRYCTVGRLVALTEGETDG